MSGSEFDLIEGIVAALGDTATTGDGVAIGPGDDAAVLELPAHHHLVVSTDTLVAGRHYPEDAAPELIGWRSMAVAASDLAAMGAAPAWATVALVAPQLAADWATRFADGIGEAARDFGMKIVGGNLAQGPPSATVTVHGHLPANSALARTGAQPGDHVYVTGLLGGAALALDHLPRLAACTRNDLREDSPLRRYWRPTPRFDFGAGLRGLATAAIDISDGFAADIAHICKASAVRCEIDIAHLPLFPDCEAQRAVSAGDDYELAFTAPPEVHDQIQALSQRTCVPATHIGTVSCEPPSVPVWHLKGEQVTMPTGYRHF